MIVLEKYRLMERLIGLDPLGGRGQVFLRFIHSVPITLFNLMELAFIISNIADGVDQVIYAVAPLFGAIPPMACYIHLLINRHRYHSILNDLEDIVNKSA